MLMNSSKAILVTDARQKSIWGRQWFRVVLSIACIFTVVIMANAIRPVAILLSILAAIFSFRSIPFRQIASLLCAFSICSLFSPIEVMPHITCAPGINGHHFRVVPLAMGLPTKLGKESASRGGIILGGDLVSGLEPKRFLTW